MGREDFTRLALETRLTEFNLGTGEASVARSAAQCYCRSRAAVCVTVYLLRPPAQPKHAPDTAAGGGTLLCCVAQTPAQPDHEGSGDGDTLEAPAPANSVSKVCTLITETIMMVMDSL